MRPTWLSRPQLYRLRASSVSEMTKKMSGMMTIAMMSRQVSAEAITSGVLCLALRYMGRKRLVSKKARTRIDQKGQRILPKKKIEIIKTTRKYLVPSGAVDAFLSWFRCWDMLNLLIYRGLRWLVVEEFELQLDLSLRYFALLHRIIIQLLYFETVEKYITFS